MNESIERKRGAILSYVSIILTTFIQLVYTPFLIKNLGDSEYGIYSLAVSVIGYLAVMDFGFSDAIIMYTARFHAEKNIEREKMLQGMFSLIFKIIGAITIVGGIVLYINVPSIFGESMTSIEVEKMKILMLIMIFNLAVTFYFSVHASVMKAYERFTFLKTVSIINSILQPIIMIPVLLIGYKAIALALVITLLNIITSILNYWYCKTKLSITIKYCGFDWGLFKGIFSYSFYIFLNIIVDKINWSTDQFVLGVVSGTTAVSIYAVAAKMNDMFIRLSSAISGVLFPKISKMIAQKASDEDLSAEFIKIGRIQYLIIFLMASGLVIFGKEFFIAWVGIDYVESYYVAMILIIPLCVPLIQNLGISILQAKNLHKFRSILYFYVAIGNIFLTFYLSSKLGAIGAALGTAVSLFIGNIIIINIYYYKKANLNIPKFWYEIIKMTIPFLIPIILIVSIKSIYVISGFIGVFIYGMFYVFIYIIIAYILVLNEYEKSLVNKIFSKIRNAIPTIW